ncbi:polyphosphate kinase 2 family protein [bacterium]|nr:polyphosphate kinase 2 family protein [bacterium]
MNWRNRFRIKPGQRVDLADLPTDDTAGCQSRAGAERRLAKLVARLADLQYRLYAENRRAVLVVLQAMDAGGKDGTIRHVLGPLNPQGCRVTSFKAPTSEELEHDFLWRIHRAVPRRGEIGVFNRSHYEDVLIVRVHDLVPKRVWSKRYDQINQFEQMLTANDVVILKFFLHISLDEQKERFEKRLHDPRRNWKFNPADIEERRLWPNYQQAYAEALRRCSTRWAPWYAIPADKKWFRNLAVATILCDALEELDMQFPKPAHNLSKIKIR